MTRTYPKKKSNTRSEIPVAGNQQQRSSGQTPVNQQKSRVQSQVEEINQQKSQKHSADGTFSKKKSSTRSEIPVAGNQQQRSSGQTPINQQKSRSQTPVNEMVNQRNSRSQTPVNEVVNQQKSRSQTPVYEKSVDQTSIEEITSTSLQISESAQRTSGRKSYSMFRSNQDLEGSHETSSFSDITQGTLSDSSLKSNSRIGSDASEGQDLDNYLRSPANAPTQPNLQGLRERYGNIRLPAKYHHNTDKRERREEREITSRRDDGIDIVLTYYYFRVQ
jgi:hypothetical protein